MIFLFTLQFSDGVLFFGMVLFLVYLGTRVVLKYNNSTKPKNDANKPNSNSLK